MVCPGRSELAARAGVGSTPYSATGAGAPIRRRGLCPGYRLAPRGAVFARSGSRVADARTYAECVVKWFWQRARTGRKLQLRSRDEASDAHRVDFEELAPEIDTFLGQAAYLQLGYFETLTELIASTPELAEKESLSRAAGAALTKHEELVALIRERGDDPTSLMLPFREPLDAFRRATHGVRPQETMLSVHITAGMLDDFYLALSSSYGDTGPPRRPHPAGGRRPPGDRRHHRARRSRATRSGSRCWRMWGRRLVGDTLLIARAALRPVDPAGRGRAEGRARVHRADGRALAAHGRDGARGLSAAAARGHRGRSADLEPGALARVVGDARAGEEQQHRVGHHGGCDECRQPQPRAVQTRRLPR